jgi:hypothetical protein
LIAPLSVIASIFPAGRIDPNRSKKPSRRMIAPEGAIINTATQHVWYA